MLLTHKIVQPFIRTLEEALPYRVTITDVNGYIIGSSDTSRLNQFHPSAYEIIQGRQPVETLSPDGIWDIPEGVILGSGEKIEYEGECIGLIGLIGPPEELQLHVKTAALMLKLLLDRKRAQEEVQLLTAEKNTFIANLVLGQPGDERRVEDRGRLYGLDLHLPRTVAVIRPDFARFENEEPLALSKIRRELFAMVKAAFPHDQDMLCELYTEKIIVLSASECHNDAQRRRKITEKALHHFAHQARSRFAIPLLIGVSAEEREFTRYNLSYDQAILAMDIGGRTKGADGIYYYEDMRLGRLAAGLSAGAADMLRDSVIDKLRAAGEEGLRETLVCYFEHNTSVSDTAAALFLHRNTLQYRFRQVKDITGFDLRQIDDLLLLRLAVLRYQYHQPDRKD